MSIGLRRDFCNRCRRKDLRFLNNQHATHNPLREGAGSHTKTRLGASFVCASMTNNRHGKPSAHTKTQLAACFVCASMTNNRPEMAAAHTKTQLAASFVCASMSNNRSGKPGAHTKTQGAAGFVCASLTNNRHEQSATNKTPPVNTIAGLSTETGIARGRNSPYSRDIFVVFCRKVLRFSTSG